MVVENKNFGASVDDWVKETEQRILAVFKESTRRVASIANNGVPVRDGFARASIRASTEEMPKIDPKASNKEGKTFGENFGQIVLVINGAKLGQVLHIGWTAAYMLPLEFGHSQQAPSGFLRIAAAQWETVVGQVTAELKGRSSAQ